MFAIGRGIVASVHDVAKYILRKKGRLTTWKLQKLVYYCQAWSLVWDEKPLFRSRIEAWANGPVVPELYKIHRGDFSVRNWPKGDTSSLTEDQRETIDNVLDFYGDKTSQWLRDLTHMEDPWINARKGLPPGVPGNNEITRASMLEYYDSIS